MNSFYCKFYSIGCLLLLVINSVLADELNLPLVTSCTFNVPKEQQSFMLSRCLDAAKVGDKEAQYQLGLYYSENKLIAPDYKEALFWFKEASAQAYVEAQVKLGYMYLNGQGIPANSMQAYIIFKIAGINGSDEAMDEADEVIKKMSPEEIQQANYILGKTFRHYFRTLGKQP